MGGAISQSVNPMTTLSLAQAVLGDEKSVTRAVNGQSFQLICVPESMGGGYLLFSHPDAGGNSERFEIASDGGIKTSSSTVGQGDGARTNVGEVLDILRSMQDTDRR